MKKLEEKKEKMAERMSGKCSICGRNHPKSMHSQKGHQSLNSPHIGRDNDVREGKDEQEKS